MLVEQEQGLGLVGDECDTLNPKKKKLKIIQFKSLSTVKIMDFKKKLFEIRTSQFIHTIHTQLIEKIIMRKFGFYD